MKLRSGKTYEFPCKLNYEHSSSRNGPLEEPSLSPLYESDDNLSDEAWYTQLSSDEDEDEHSLSLLE